MRKPWFRKADGWWCIHVGTGAARRIKRLSQDETEAIDKWHQDEARSNPAPDRPLTALLEAFLDWSKRNNKPATYDYHQRYLEALHVTWGLIPASDLRPFHLTQLVETEKLPRGAERAVVVCAKAAMNWAVEQGILDFNPIAKAKRPPASPDYSAGWE